jgi:hypothetical protein
VAQRGGFEQAFTLRLIMSSSCLNRYSFVVFAISSKVLCLTTHIRWQQSDARKSHRDKVVELCLQQIPVLENAMKLSSMFAGRLAEAARSRRVRFLGLSAVVLLIASLQAFAQDATIMGAVTDSTGAAWPNVAGTITNQETGFSITTEFLVDVCA